MQVYRDVRGRVWEAAAQVLLPHLLPAVIPGQLKSSCTAADAQLLPLRLHRAAQGSRGGSVQQSVQARGA